MPKEPEEPTSTLVLTSKASYFVDVRVFKDKWQEEAGRGRQRYSAGILQWAFAGTSQSYHEDGKRFSKWSHWIDSHTDEPEEDKGQMIDQENGDVLERGTNVDAVSGKETTYEELWTDLEITTTSPEAKRVCVVLQAEDNSSSIKGMLIRIGTWCQCILKAETGVTVDRWLWHAQDSDNAHGEWRQEFCIGPGELPCPADVPFENIAKTGAITKAGLTWKLVEDYSW